MLLSNTPSYHIAISYLAKVRTRISITRPRLWEDEHAAKPLIATVSIIYGVDYEEPKTWNRAVEIECFAIKSFAQMPF